MTPLARCRPLFQFPFSILGFRLPAFTAPGTFQNRTPLVLRSTTPAPHASTRSPETQTVPRTPQSQSRPAWQSASLPAAPPRLDSASNTASRTRLSRCSASSSPARSWPTFAAIPPVAFLRYASRATTPTNNSPGASPETRCSLPKPSSPSFSNEIIACRSHPEKRAEAVPSARTPVILSRSLRDQGSQATIPASQQNAYVILTGKPAVVVGSVGGGTEASNAAACAPAYRPGPLVQPFTTSYTIRRSR
jgi:hypothetical protein